MKITHIPLPIQIKNQRGHQKGIRFWGATSRLFGWAWDRSSSGTTSLSLALPRPVWTVQKVPEHTKLEKEETLT